MLKFDKNGYIYPYDIIELTLEEFEFYFVNELEDNAYRKDLFAAYLRFNEVIKKEIRVPYCQWIDGSFTTQKPFPGDIDVVCFINYDTFIKNGRFFNRLAQQAKELFNVDAHFGTTASWRHRFYKRTLVDEEYWKEVFGSSRPDENLKKHLKGIIKINL